MFGLFKKKTLDLCSPMQGEVIDITQVPDAVFSQKMVDKKLSKVPAFFLNPT